MRHLARWLGTRALRKEIAGQEGQERETWGIGKDRKEVTAITIYANLVRKTRLRQEGCNEKFEDRREIGSAWQTEGKQHSFL